MTLLVATIRANPLEVGETIEVDGWDEALEVAFDMVMRRYEEQGIDAATSATVQEEIRNDIQENYRHELYQQTSGVEEYDPMKAQAVQILGTSDV